MKDPAENWRELSRDSVFERYGRGVDRVLFRLPDGSDGTYFVNRQRPTVAVLALTPQAEVVLVRQFRPGPKAMLLEMPGGFLDEGEDAATAAQRELMEETGFQGDLIFAGRCYGDAYSTAIKYCYVATHCIQSVAPQAEDGGVRLSTRLVPVSEFREILRSGDITDVDVGYICLDALGLLSSEAA